MTLPMPVDFDLPSDEELASVHLDLSMISARIVHRPRRGAGKRVIVTREGWSYETGKAFA